jgi:hypothetical protein
MTESPGTPETSSSAFASDADEVSLADSLWSQEPDSVPDTLEVRNDSIAVMQNSMASFRRPVVIAVGVVGAAVALLVAAGFLRKLGQGDVTPPA